MTYCDVVIQSIAAVKICNCSIAAHVTVDNNDGIIQLHFVGKFGGFAVALESSGEKHNLLLASLKGMDDYSSVLLVQLHNTLYRY